MASRIKIKVVDNENNFKLRLPAIPFWLITSLSSLVLRFKPIIINNVANLDEEGKFFLEQMDRKVIKELINELKRNGRFDLVDVSTGNGTMVKISIL